MRRKPVIGPTLSASRRNPLAACIATLFALTAPDVFAANTWVVNSCADSGSNTLRDVVANFAQSGDTVDVSQLTCGPIGLTNSAITISQGSLTIQGPSPPRVEVISGYYNGAYTNDRVFTHTGSGTLVLNGLQIENGKFTPASGNANGGCIYSAGSVYLNHTTVIHCQLAANNAIARGGGVFARSKFGAKYSLIVGNSASGTEPVGGGVYAGGDASLSYSTISGNNAAGGNAGGIVAYGSASISGSTISGNSAHFTGGLSVFGADSPFELKLTNSTISGNSSSNVVGGMSSAAANTIIQNSTIAFNTAAHATPNQGPGLYLFNGSPTASTAYVDLESSILSNNTYGTTENDFGVGKSNSASTFVITSHNSIVRSAPGTQRPATVTTACPLLGPLRANGGATWTHALMSHSPAIGMGNNAANLNEDQRGRPFVDSNNPYPFARVSGAAADIGAYEVQQNDIVFNAGFEGCP